jgi:hypothetical protein
MSASPQPPAILNVHTPISSWSIIHSPNEEHITELFDKLSRKGTTEFKGARVGPGWLKYEWNDGVWNLDDGRLIFSLSTLPSYTQICRFRLYNMGMAAEIHGAYHFDNTSIVAHPFPSISRLSSSGSFLISKPIVLPLSLLQSVFHT